VCRRAARVNRVPEDLQRALGGGTRGCCRAAARDAGCCLPLEAAEAAAGARRPASEGHRHARRHACSPRASRSRAPAQQPSSQATTTTTLFFFFFFCYMGGAATTRGYQVNINAHRHAGLVRSGLWFIKPTRLRRTGHMSSGERPTAGRLSPSLSRHRLRRDPGSRLVCRPGFELATFGGNRSS
jgi:hypothetical protein